MNAETVLQVFLPYHDSPNFARILAILDLSKTSPYNAPFAALAKRAQPVPREYITNAVSSARDPSLRLLTDVCSSVRDVLEENTVHRALLAFWTATLVDLLERARNGAGGRVPEGTVKVLVETFITLLSTRRAGPEVNAAVYPPLVLLSRSIKLSDAPFAAVVEALLTPNTGAEPSQRVLTLLVLLDGRKGWNKGLGSAAASNLAEIPQLGQLLVAAMEKYGFETALQTIMRALLQDVVVSRETLTILVDFASLPVSVVKIVAEQLLEVPTEAHDVARSLLSTLRQRHPDIVDKAVLDVSKTSTVDSSLVQWSSAETAFVDVHSADVASRVSGVREMYAVAEAAGLDRNNASELLSGDETLRSAQTAVVARLRDTDEEVLTAIYAQPDTLLALLDGIKYIDAITPTFAAPKPDSTALGLHLSFIGSYYIAAHTEADREVFERLLIPNLLAIEGRRALLQEQWPAAIKSSRLLDRAPTPVAPGASSEQLVKFNQNLIKSLSSAIASCGDIGARVDSLVGSLSSPLPSARLLAALTLAQLVSNAGGYQSVVAARSLKALEGALTGMSLVDVMEIESPLSDNLLKAVATKPAAARTQQRVYLALLACAATVAPSPNSTTTWLGDVSSDGSEGQARTIAHALYRWANSASLAANVARHLLQAVFGQLGEAALIFLASVWTSDADSALRVAALRHATAFVSAYTSGGKDTDFQLAIPATLVALQDSDKTVRTAASALLRAVASAPQSASADIYGLETVYGTRSGKHNPRIGLTVDLVQLLKPSDLTKYLQTLVASLDEMVVDAGRLALVQSSALDLQSRNGRKDTLYRRDVVDWLMSNILGWRADGPRRALLSTLERAVNVSRLQGSLPLLTPLIDASKDEAEWLETMPSTHRAEYLDLVFNSFTAQHSAAVTDAGSEAWKFLLSLVSATSGLSLHLRTLSLQRMADGLFNALSPAQKAEYLVALISSLHQLSTDEKLSSKATLAKLALTSADLISIIETLRQPLESSVVRKRAKHDDEGDKIDQAVADFTVLVESRDWKALPGDANVVAALLTVLASILSKRQVITDGVDYAEQEILGGVLAQIEQINDASEILRARVGIEVIVKVIRASTNPRTAQRALLVASELARLIPDSVLHNVMPIFTFLGGSDLQRDDAFSFNVVEKTVERIVPVMATSLKDKSTSKLDLYVQSRAFLAIFTDMAGRLPRHRTLPFFVHFVKSLGARDFLAPVCMLLADKSKSLELPLSLVAAFNAPARADTIVELVREAARLIAAETDDSETFLGKEDGRAPVQVAVLLQLTAGIEKGMGGKVPPQYVVEEIVKSLITLAPSVSELDLPEAQEYAEAALTGAMRLLSVDSFLATVSRILESEVEADIDRVLDLFTQRLPQIKPDVRAKSPSMGKIISRTSTLLSGSCATHALSALSRVVSTAVSTEDSALAAATPAIVASTKAVDAETAPSSLALLGALVRRLGPRSIPFVQSILDACLGLIRGSTRDTAAAAFGTLAALVETVPTFISSKQLVSLLGAAAEHRAADETASATLMSTAAKKIPSKTIIPVVMELWKVLKSGAQAPTEAFFALLRHVLRHADRTALPTQTKSLFAFFLDVFDLRYRATSSGKLTPEAVDAVESSAIASFLELVTKLSDAAFKPLFARLYDWAVVDLSAPANDSHQIARRTVLLRVMDGLLDRFRHLLTPYMGVLLPLIDELLTAYSVSEVDNANLWALLLSVLGKSFDVDDGAFWADSGLLKLLPSLIAQLSLEGDLAVLAASAESPIATALAALAASCTSETTLKKVNNAVCLATRADEPKARMASLRTLDAMWERHSDELIQFVPETVAEFLAELLEDENAEVEGLARKVLARIEGVTGSLKEYLE